MLRTLSQLPTLTGLVLFVLVPNLVSAVMAFVVRRSQPVAVLRENNEFAAITYPVIGVFYGVFLAFAIVIVWQRYTAAEQSAYSEVAALAELWRDAQVFPAEHRDRMHERTRGYVVAVLDKEWPSMSSRNADRIRDDAYEALWKAYYAFEPHTETEKAFYAKSLDQLNQVGTSRQERLIFSASDMPALLWGFLLFGAAVTVTFSYFLGTKHHWTHALTCAAITSLVGFSLLLIMSMQYPFAGGVSVASTPYSDLLQKFDGSR